MKKIIFILILFLSIFSIVNSKSIVDEERLTLNDIIIEKLYSFVDEIFDDIDIRTLNKSVDVETFENDFYKIKVFYRNRNLDVKQIENLNSEIIGIIRKKFGFILEGDLVKRVDSKIKIIGNLKELNISTEKDAPENIDDFIFAATVIEVVGKSRSDSVYCLDRLTTNTKMCHITKKL